MVLFKLNLSIFSWFCILPSLFIGILTTYLQSLKYKLLKKWLKSLLNSRKLLIGNFSFILFLLGIYKFTTFISKIFLFHSNYILFECIFKCFEWFTYHRHVFGQIIQGSYKILNSFSDIFYLRKKKRG